MVIFIKSEYILERKSFFQIFVTVINKIHLTFDQHLIYELNMRAHNL